MAEEQEGQRIQRFPELDTIIDMVNWWIVWINKCFFEFKNIKITR